MAINKYNNSKIYRIVSNVSDDVYYGSTTEPTIARRLAKHVGNYKCYLNGKSNFTTSFKILETNDYDIILVENVNCETKEQLHQRERFYIENNNCVNKFIPNRTDKQYRFDNKDSIKETKKQYYNENLDSIKNKIEQYQQDNKEKIQKQKNKPNRCECGSHYTTANKSQHFKSTIHIDYIKSQEIRISKYAFDFIFVCDSRMKMPKTYPNFIIN
jgi:hypothetical protein